jgi:hypothetical protein
MIQEKVIDSLKQVNNSLLKAMDSLKLQNQIDQLTHKIETQNSIATEVNSFYDSAWIKLIFVITILGIILPLIVQYFQRKNLKELTEDLKDKFDSKLENLKKDNELKIDSSLQKYKKKIKKIEAKNNVALTELESNTFHLQGRALFNEKSYLISVGSYLYAALLSKKCARIDRVALNLKSTLLGLKKMKDDDFKNVDSFLKENFGKQDLEQSLKELEQDLNNDSIVNSKIQNIRDFVIERNSA